MTLDDSLLILASIYNYIFYENDTNEVKGSYHDDRLEKRKKKYFAYWTGAWRLAAPEICIL